MLLSRVAALLLGLSVLLGQRIHLDVAGGLVDPFMAAFIPLATLSWLRSLGRSGGHRGAFLFTVGPLLALILVLPLIGVLVGLADTRHLYAVIVPASILAALSLGPASRVHGLRIDSIGFVLIVVHGLYGTAQALYRLGFLPSQVWTWAADWDSRSQLALDEAYWITNRSTGLFINANSFGLWSCLAAAFAGSFLQGKKQAIAIIFAIVGVISSQSRTALVTLGVLGLLLFVRSLRSGLVRQRVFRTIAFAVPIGIFAGLLGWLPLLVEDQLLDRLASGLGVVEGGFEADANLDARVGSWQGSWEFSGTYPFGTLGPPERLLGTFIDNGYVYVWLQGGALLVGAYLVALVTPWTLSRLNVSHANRLWAVALTMGIMSLTMTPLQTFAPSALAWLAGATLLGARESPRHDVTALVDRDHMVLSTPQ